MSTANEVEVSLWHCGVEPITFGGASWEVPDEEEPFDATNAPASFVGRGSIQQSDDGAYLTYTDQSGVVLRFVPDDGAEPPCA